MKTHQAVPSPWSRWQRWKYGYDNIAAEETCLDCSSLEDGNMNELNEEKSLRNLNSHRSRVNKCTSWLTILNLAILLTTIILINHGHLWCDTADKNSCVRATSYFSPVIESIRIEHQQVLLNGTLWPRNEPSFSRKEPGGPEAEAVWNSFETFSRFPITREDVIALGKDPNTVARFPDETFGLGDGAYIAALDIQHKLHCLNELRKMAFADYGKQTPKKKAHSQLWWIHLRHCVDMLTQDMICHADADLITYRWMDTQPNPFPDMSINRKCRNLDDLLKYRDDHKVDDDKYSEIEKPRSGIIQVPQEPGYYAMFGFGDSDLYPNGEGYGPLPKTEWFGTPLSTD